MADFLAVVPSIYQPSTDACLATMSTDLLANGIVIDNTVHNRGVSKSWNMGIDAMTERNADWLVLISAAVRFGPSGGADFLASLDEPGLLVMEAMHVGWQCIAFHWEVFERVGRFDENFYPGYFEDLDFGWRIALAYGLTPPYWDKRPFDLESWGWSHSSKLAGVVCDPDKLMGYLRAKWGNVPGHGPTWHHPWNDETLPVSYWPDPHEFLG